MKDYTVRQTDVIVADSFGELTYRQKKLLCAALGERESKKCADELIKSCGGGVYNKIKGLFSKPKYRDGVLSELNEKGVECIVYGDDDYPVNLAATPVPPLVLYCMGNSSLLERTRFAIVGSRRTPQQALALCRETAQELSCELVIVTGVADGADGAALEGALENKNVIAVLPNGFDHFYPACNTNLIKRVARDGLLISEYPPSVAPQRFQFAARNRIIAGLSEGVLVVSAPKKSGALITAGYAADYGRDVFAFPYSPNIFSGEGCNGLIKKGAYLAEGAQDIFSVYGIDEKKSDKAYPEGDEIAVYAFLKENGEAHVSAIAKGVNKPEFEVMATLSMLEIKRLAVKTGGNRYAVC